MNNFNKPLTLKEKISMEIHESTKQAIMRADKLTNANKMLAAAKTPEEVKAAEKEIKMAEKAIKNADEAKRKLIDSIGTTKMAEKVEKMSENSESASENGNITSDNEQNTSEKATHVKKRGRKKADKTSDTTDSTSEKVTKKPKKTTTCKRKRRKKADYSDEQLEKWLWLEKSKLEDSDEATNSNSKNVKKDSTTSSSDSSLVDVSATFKPSGHEFIPDFNVKTELSKSKITSQMEALYYLFKGDNVVLCGKAGSGKSWVINTFRTIIDSFNAVLGDGFGLQFNIATTASTGAAAVIIDGVTVHSWSGLGVNLGPFDSTTIRSIVPNSNKWLWKKLQRRLRSVDCLIIDEISMLPSYFLANLDFLMRTVRNNSKPFGGVQIVLVGDFLQLPPVYTGEKGLDGRIVDYSYCFNASDENGANIFKKSNFKYCYLDRNMRSKDDDKLTTLLNNIRENNIDDDTVKMLESRFVKDENISDSRTFMKLFTTNVRTDAYNSKELAAIDKPSRTYYLDYDVTNDENEKLIKSMKLSDITLKVGAKVMLTSNTAVDNDSCVNGSIGEVVSMGRDTVDVLFNNGCVETVPMVVAVKDQSYYEAFKIKHNIVGKVLYLPLKLAWAITVHKSQGQTFDGVDIDLKKCFTKGLGYVALSRAKNLDSIIIEGTIDDLSPNALLLNDTARAGDGIIMKWAKWCRERFTENEQKIADTNVLSKYGENNVETKVGYDEIMGDDHKCFEYVKNFRAKPIAN